jgi:hypothetical protein
MSEVRLTFRQSGGLVAIRELSGIPEKAAIKPLELARPTNMLELTGIY